MQGLQQGLAPSRGLGDEQRAYGTPVEQRLQRPCRLGRLGLYADRRYCPAGQIDAAGRRRVRIDPAGRDNDLAVRRDLRLQLGGLEEDRRWR